MAIFSKFFNRIKRKDTTIVNLDGMARIMGAQWNKSQYLQSYEKSLYVYACVSKIAEKIGSIEIKLFQILNSRGDTKELQSHPALDLIYRVNPFQTKSEFLETTIINLKLAGNAFWWKVRNNSGRVVELWNLRPDRMTIVSDPTNFIKQYEFQKNDGTKEVFAPDDIVHFKYPSPVDQYLGMAPLRPAAVRVDTEEYASTFQRDFFLNNSRPDAVLKTQQQLNTNQRRELKDDWEEKHLGIGNNSKLAILEAGMEYQVISLTQKEMDFVESMKFTRDDILVAFKVPKPIVAVVDDVNRANAETAMFIFLSETIKPEMMRLVEKMNEMLLIPDFGENLFYDFADPTPDNRDLKLREYESGIKNNYLLINEVRQKEGLAPIKGGWSFYTPLGVVPTGGLPQNEGKNFVIQERKERIFAGRYMFKKKLEIGEEILKRLAAPAPKKKIGKKSKTSRNKKEVRKIISIIPAELKKDYAEIMIKAIDRKAKQLEEAMTAEAFKQQDRVLKALKAETKSVKEKKLDITDIFDIENENVLLSSFVVDFLKTYLEEAGKDALNLLAPAEDFAQTARVDKYLAKRSAYFAESVNNTTLEKLKSTLSEGIADGEGVRDLAERVGTTYQEFPDYRSDLIARTEATAANNEGLLEGYRQSGVATHKEWVATLDDRTRPEHLDLNGEVVKTDENFSNGLAFPSEPNCRCVIAPAFQE
jgi:HK97 family phage portal protein